MKKLFQIVSVLFTSLLLAMKPKTTIQVEHLEFWSKKGRKRALEQGNLDKAVERATELQHLEENESLEDYENDNSFSENDFDESYEDDFQSYLDEEGLDTENLSAVQRMKQRRIARRMAKKRGKKGGVYAAQRFRGRRQILGRNAGLAGTQTIVITRNSYNIPYDLPVQVFNSLDSLCNSPLVKKYITNPDIQFLGGYIDATVTNFVFRFRQISTNLVDTVTISCNEASYVKLIVGLQTDMYQVKGGTMRISDETKTGQFDKQFAFSSQNILGKESSNPLNTGAWITPDNFRKDTAYLKVTFPVDKENGFIFNSAYFSGTPVGYQLTTTFFLDLSAIAFHNFKKILR